jgi:hypothetical protein
VTIHDLLDLIKRLPWVFWLVVGAVVWARFKPSWKWRAGQRGAREAENWPVFDGMVQSIDVKPHVSKDRYASGCDALFTYSYSVLENRETEYFSGDFLRTLPDEATAWEWLQAMKGKRIRVHVQPGRPKVSAVLTADLDAQFSLPTSFIDAATPAVASAPANLPAELRGITEFAAWLAAVGFSLSLADHLCRLLRGRPLHPQLATVLGVAFFAVAVPFGLWYQRKAGQSIFGKPKDWARVPSWLRICTYVLNLYVGSFWLIDMVLSSGILHAHWDLHRLEPMSNGAFFALLYGDAAAILYSRLESFEDHYSLSASGLHPH